MLPADLIGRVWPMPEARRGSVLPGLDAPTHKPPDGRSKRNSLAVRIGIARPSGADHMAASVPAQRVAGSGNRVGGLIPKRGSAMLGMGAGFRAPAGARVGKARFAAAGAQQVGMGSLAAACRHEAEMDEPRSMEEYLQADAGTAESFNCRGGSGKRRLRQSRRKEAFAKGLKERNMDPTADEEAEKLLEENLWKYYRLLSPASHFKQRWDPFIQMLVVYNSGFIPLSLAFAYRLATTHTIADYAVDLLFVMDMVVSCSTVYHNQHFELVIDRRKIVSHYVRTWFVIDLLSILPLEVFAYVLSSDPDAQYLIADFLRLPRMLRLARFRKRVASAQTAGANARRMIWLCVLFVFIAHIVACCWWAIGRLGLPQNLGTDRHSRSWILRMEEQGTVQLIDPFNPFDQSRIPTQYLTSLYWALTCLLKSPSIGPDTEIEKVFTTVVTIFGVLVFTVFVGNTIEVLQSVSHSDEKRRKHMYTLSNFVRQNHLSRDLRQKIFAHFAAEYRSTLGIDASLLLHQFPRSLRGQIVVYMHRHTLQTCELFKVLTSECVKAILMCVIPTVCLQKEVLIGQGELCEYIYIMMRGAMQVRDASANDRTFATGGADRSNSSTVIPALAQAVWRASKRILVAFGRTQGDETTSSATAERTSVSTSPGNRSTKKKGAPNFHPIERAGSLIGLHDPKEGSVLYPYTVVASKTASLLRLTGEDLRSILASHGGSDQKAGRDLVRREFEAVQAGLLKGNRKTRLMSLHRSRAIMSHGDRDSQTDPCASPTEDACGPDASSQPVGRCIRESPGSAAEAQDDGGARRASVNMRQLEASLLQGAQVDLATSSSGPPATKGSTSSCSFNCGASQTKEWMSSSCGNETPNRYPEPHHCPLESRIGAAVAASNALGHATTPGEVHSRKALLGERERKNSMTVTDAEEEDYRRTEVAKAIAREDEQWRKGADDLRHDMAAAGRKLQNLITSMAAMESDLALLPNIAEALAALESISSNSPPPVSVFGFDLGGTRTPAVSTDASGIQAQSAPRISSGASGGAGGLFGFLWKGDTNPIKPRRDSELPVEATPDASPTAALDGPASSHAMAIPEPMASDIPMPLPSGLGSAGSQKGSKPGSYPTSLDLSQATGPPLCAGMMSHKQEARSRCDQTPPNLTA